MPEVENVSMAFPRCIEVDYTICTIFLFFFGEQLHAGHRNYFEIIGKVSEYYKLIRDLARQTQLHIGNNRQSFPPFLSPPRQNHVEKCKKT